MPPSGLLEAADGMIAEATVTALDSATAEHPAAPQAVDIEIGGSSTLPEFTAALQGMSPGGQRELEVAYPSDHPNKDLAGKTAHYRIELSRASSASSCPS